MTDESSWAGFIIPDGLGFRWVTVEWLTEHPEHIARAAPISHGLAELYGLKEASRPEAQDSAP